VAIAVARTRYASRIPDTTSTSTFSRREHWGTDKLAGPSDNSTVSRNGPRDDHVLTESTANVADDRATNLSRPMRMLGLLCLRPTASPVGKPRPAGLVRGPGSAPCGSQGACSPGSTRTARHHLSRTRQSLVDALRAQPDQTFTYGQIATVTESTCCACGMTSLPVVCSVCPLVDLLSSVLALPARDVR
jgi:hypothetical protein